MSQTFSDIGSWFGQNLPKVGGFLKSNVGTILPAAMTGFGFLNNLFNQNRYNRQQDLAYNLAKNPQAAAAYTQGFERPLAAGLTQGVENQVQAALGERGLSMSPAISAAVYSQALAPYIQDQQRLAAQEAMGFLGAGTSFPQARSTDVSGPLAALMNALKQRGTSSTPPSVSPGANTDTGIGSMPAGTYPDVWQWPTAPTGTNPDTLAAAPDWGLSLSGASSDPNAAFQWGF